MQSQDLEKASKVSDLFHHLCYISYNMRCNQFPESSFVCGGWISQTSNLFDFQDAQPFVKEFFTETAGS